METNLKGTINKDGFSIFVTEDNEYSLGRWWSLYEKDTDRLKSETSNPREILNFYCEGDRIVNLYTLKHFDKSIPVPKSFEFLAEYVDGLSR